MDATEPNIIEMLNELLLTYGFYKRDISAVTKISIAQLNKLLQNPEFNLQREKEARLARLHRRIDLYEKHLNQGKA
jgi:hypothetical protein